MARINRVPNGLQALLDAKNLGVNPADLNEAVSPTLDLHPFFASTLIRVSSNGTASIPIVAGSAVDVTVPQGEIWSPISFAAITEGIDVAVQIGIAARIITPLSGTNQECDFAWNQIQGNAAANYDLRAVARFHERVWFWSGTVFRCVCTHMVNGPNTGTLESEVMYYRLTI